MQNCFRILSIDGGGIRGIFPAYILQRIEDAFEINIYENINMFAGTSTGSIIAASGACKISFQEIVHLYSSCGKKIFKRRKFYLPSKLQSIFESMYESSDLNTTLSTIFKDKKLGELEKPLLIPATDIGNGLVHIFKSNYPVNYIRDKEIKVKDAILASCSAPTYFDPKKITDYLLADGGLWANNPSLAAVLDAKEQLGIDFNNIKILSIGTGSPKTAYGTNQDKTWGFVNGWEHKEFIAFILSLQSLSTTNYLKKILSSEQITRLDFETENPLPLDDLSCIDDLKSRADSILTHNSDKIKKFFSSDSFHLTVSN